MKILVTGGAGFIGSHIVDKLIEQGNEVIVVDNLSTGYRENINPKAKFYQTDITSKDLHEVFSIEKPQYVFHQGAQTDVQTSLKDPTYDAMVNIIGTINVLEECRKNGVEKIIYASSAAGYGNNLNLPLKEEEGINPLSFYGVSKHTPEHYFPIYQELYNLEYTILRYANVYGPRQISKGEGGVVAIFTSMMTDKKQPKIFGDGKQTRDFIYVEDLADANIKAIKNGNGEIINISSQKQTSVIDLFKIINELLGDSLSPIFSPERPGEIRDNSLANAKAERLLGWGPSTSIEKGLQKTLDFYNKQD